MLETSATYPTSVQQTPYRERPPAYQATGRPFSGISAWHDPVRVEQVVATTPRPAWTHAAAQGGVREAVKATTAAITTPK